MVSRRLVSLVSAVILVTACSGGGSGSSPADAPRIDAASGLVPNNDGFAFANFGSSNTPEIMNGEDLRMMFGDGVCSNGAAIPCEPTSEAAAWAQMVNQSRQAGHCEGMVVQAVSRFTNNASPKTVELENKEDTTHGIIRAFATQFFPAVRKEADTWAKKSLSEIVGALTNSFSSKTLTYTMGLYSDSGGHAVLPISVEYPTESTAKVHIYDSNWPGADRYVLFDFQADTWEFSFSGQDPANDPGVWKGGKGDIDLASMDSRLSTDAPFDTGADSVVGNFLVIRSATLDWSVKTSTGVVSPKQSTDLASTVRPLRTAVSKSVPEYVVYTDSTEVELNLPGVSSAYAVGGGKVVSVVTTGSTSPIAITPAEVSIPDAAELSVADGDLAATVKGGAATVSVQDTSLTVTADGITQKVLANEQKPRITVTIKNGKLATTAGSAITELQPTVPAGLVQPDTKPGLTPQNDRSLTSASVATTTVVATTTTSAAKNTTTTTTVKTTATTTSAAPSSTSSSVAPTTTAPSTTTNNQNNIVALQAQNSGFTWYNNQTLSTFVFKLINANNQWASTASGTCSIALLPEFDNGSLAGATLTGPTTTTANGTGSCYFSGLTINGTTGAKYRIRATLQGSNANTTIGPQTLAP